MFKYWNAYWFGRDAPISLAVVRVALGISALWSCWTALPGDVAGWLASQNPLSYEPVGVLWLLGNSPPSFAVVQVVLVVGLCSAALAILGLLTRTSMALSLIANLLLAGLAESFYLDWSHRNNFVLLAQLAFVFAPAGSCWSIDNFIRQRFWRSGRSQGGSRGVQRSSLWPVLLTQMALALAFANAAYWKFASGGFSLDWALSDNFRNILIVQYPWVGRDMPAWLQFVADHEWAYKGLALGNLVCQAAPLMACLLIHRPLLRGLFGLFFVLETIALGLVMQIWDPQWLPLFAVFIDWDALVSRWSGAGRSQPVSSSTIDPQQNATIPNEVSRPWAIPAAKLFIVGYLAWYISIAFFAPSGMHFRLNCYPFSQFRMYSDIKSKMPYKKHQPYELLGVTFTLEGLDSEQDRRSLERTLQRHHYYMYGYLDFDRIRGGLGNVRGYCLSELNLKRGRLTMYRTVFQIPAYPASAELRVHSRGMMGTIDLEGSEQVLFAKSRLDPESGLPFLDIQHTGYAAPRFQFEYMLNYRGDLKPLPGQLTDNRYDYRPPETGRYLFVVHVTDSSLSGGEKHTYYCDFPYHDADKSEQQPQANATRN